MKRSLIFVWIGSILFAFIVCGCKACNFNAAMATLRARQGQVQQALAASQAVFKEAAVGTKFHAGDALKTAHASNALLELEGGGTLQVRQDTLIRFALKRPTGKAHGLDVQTGQVLLEAGDSEVELATEVGLARIQAGGQMVIRRGPDGTYFDVTIGKAQFETNDGVTVVESGQSYVIGIGKAVVETTEPPGRDAGLTGKKPPSDAGSSVQTAEARDGAGAAGENANQDDIDKLASGGSASGEGEGHGLAYADIVVDAGQSFTVHDPSPPTAIRFQFSGQCSTGALVKTAPHAQSAGGKSSVALAFGSGRHGYSVYCLGDDGPSRTPVARGTVTVLRDAGTRPVPRTPPSTTLSVDGHNYTVMYQNQLPSITVVWQNAPSASAYNLHWESKSGSKTATSSAPSYTFRSGTLLEGHHDVYFEAAGRFSRHTGVTVQFDNAAPTASLLTPADQTASTSGEMTISGVAQPGWQVEIGGVSVDQDAQQRFTQKLQLPTSERAVVVKLTNPARGTHYYLRRAARAHD
jgi:hypothetical protein